MEQNLPSKIQSEAEKRITIYYMYAKLLVNVPHTRPVLRPYVDNRYACISDNRSLSVIGILRYAEVLAAKEGPF
jgi:hypothetical protein